jgi:hypothetical protein
MCQDCDPNTNDKCAPTGVCECGGNGQSCPAGQKCRGAKCM